MDGIVISLCDLTGIMVEPWARAGYTCYCIDLQHPILTHKNVGAGTIYFVPADVMTYRLPKAKIVALFSFPECTDIAVSGARWFLDKGPRRLVNALDLFARCMELGIESGAPWFAENPVSVAATHFGTPTYFHPCHYAGYLDDPSPEAYTKKTGIWKGGGFIMPERKPVEPVLGSKMHLLPPSDDRHNLRSQTPRGFAEAVFLANAPHLSEAAA